MKKAILCLLVASLLAVPVAVYNGDANSETSGSAYIDFTPTDLLPGEDESD